MVAGFAAGNLIIGFAWAKESVPLLGGMLLQPGVGRMLDRHWHGAIANGARLYDAAYRAGFGLIFAAITISLILLLFARESRCVQAR